MKHSPFTFFRKHQRIGMVILTVMAMFAFVFLDQSFRGAGGAGTQANEIAVKIKGGNLTREKLGQLIAQRISANRFIQAVAGAIAEEDPKDQQLQGIAQGVLQQQFGQGFPGQPDSDISVMWGHIMRLEAKRLGMAVTDNTIESYITKLSQHRLSKDRFQEILKSIKLPEKHLYDIFREEILTKMALEATFPRINQTPEQYFEYYKRVKVRQNLEIAALPVSEFAKTIADPTDRELETLFNENKSRFADRYPNFWKPGFRQPTKVRVQYLTADLESIEKKVQEGKDKYTKPVTDKEIEEYYEKNKAKKYVEDEVEPAKPAPSKPATGGQETDPLNPEIAPEKTTTPGAAKPEGKAGDKPAEATPPGSKPVGKPAAETPATPAAEKPAEPKAEEPAKANPEAKPEEKSTEPKPAEPKPAENADKKPCGEDPAGAKAEEPKAAEPKAEPKPAAETPAADKAAEKPAEAPATTEAKPADAKPADAKPADPKPADAKPADAKPADAKADPTNPPADKPMTAGAEGDTPPKTDAVPEIKPPKFKPLDDSLKQEIRDDLENERTLESLRKMAEDAQKQLEVDQFSYAFLPVVSGKTLYIDFNANDELDDDEPSVESSKKLDQDDLNKIPRELLDELNTKLFEITAATMKKVGKKVGLEYHETELFSYKDLQENPELRSLSRVQAVTENPFQREEPGTIEDELFGSESRFHVQTGKDDETRLYVYWKVEHVKEHIAAFSDPGIKDEVLTAWKLMKAYPEATKRAEVLAGLAKGKTLHEAFKGETVTEGADSMALDVHDTRDFSWMSSGIPTPRMQSQPPPKLTEVEWTKNIDDNFMQVVFDELEVGEVGYAPNRDRSVVYVVRVVHRDPSSEEELTKLRETFMKESLFDTFPGIDPKFRHLLPLPVYSQIAGSENSKLYLDWIEALEEEYQIHWTDELKNH